MKITLRRLPKNKSMKTFQTKPALKNQEEKRLFRHLFVFQLQLERTEKGLSERHRKREKIIETINELLIELIEYCNLENE